MEEGIFVGMGSPSLTVKPDLVSLRVVHGRCPCIPSQMNKVQRKYKVLRFTSRKELEVGVNELIQREYKDTDGFIFQSSGRWQCLGRPFLEENHWHQAVVFIQEEE
ncbi:MAG: hypothetical protein CBC00_09350 [Verrucomicrobia bacterium TMED40]|nr:MAG: hypothetical protein CBC00_09350 [Verrucomicrobia bacterium TMED40]|tara:strand:- start:1077 stop:1394 length:318 start_codon:yes stop_codon:yes gene_type:complete